MIGALLKCSEKRLVLMVAEVIISFKSLRFESKFFIYANKNSECVVYGIVSEGVVKYVGSTKHYQERIKEHILKRPFLTSNNFIILKRVELNERFSYEGVLIKILKPEWNIMGV